MTIYMSAALAQAMGMILPYWVAGTPRGFVVMDQWGRVWVWPVAQGLQVRTAR